MNRIPPFWYFNLTHYYFFHIKQFCFYAYTMGLGKYAALNIDEKGNLNVFYNLFNIILVIM